MRNALYLYRRMASACLRSKLQYRSSFLLSTGGQLLGLVFEFLAVCALFQRFGNLRGWTLPEVALFYGVTHGAFALAEIVGRGFDTFSEMIRSGDFDIYLVRPRSPTLLVAGREFDLRVGRIAQAACVLAWAITQLPIAWTPARCAVLASMIVGAVCIFYGLFVLQATLCFWTVEGLEIMNAVTYGGTETAQFPLTIYRPWFRMFFTYVIPLATVNYLPVSFILGRGGSTGPQAALLAVCPITGFAFLAGCFAMWRFGVRRYLSTGS